MISMHVYKIFIPAQSRETPDRARSIARYFGYKSLLFHKNSDIFLVTEKTLFGYPIDEINETGVFLRPVENRSI